MTEVSLLGGGEATEQASKTYDPWADLGRRKGVDITWHAGTVSKWKDPRGVTTFSNLSITLRVGQREAQLRSTLTHELIHLERGPVGLPYANKSVASEEARVELLAAQRLIEPASFDQFMAITNGDPEEEAVEETLRTDWALFDSYRSWRKRVRPQAAIAAWRHGQVATQWPPAWLAANRTHYDLAARFADIARLDTSVGGEA